MRNPNFSSRLVILLLFAGALWLAACAAEPTAAPIARPTRSLARSGLAALPPTKVARLAPTETSLPTRTRVPTRTAVPTQEPTSTRTKVPLKKAATAPTAQAAAASVEQDEAPATTEPTALPTETATPTNMPAADTSLGVNASCEPTGGSDYGVLGAGGWEGRDPKEHADLNLYVRGYRLVNAFRGLVDYDGETDGDAPQLWGLFADRRTPEIAHTYQVYDWNWGSNSRGDPIEDFDVTMAGFRVSEGETIFTPDFGHEIGEGYVALVLYADTHRVTVKYTGEDNVIDGYTLHIEGICVYANLLNLYTARQDAGRGALPALRPGQPIGYAPGTEVGIAIRDRGAFLDPRSRKDWWQGR